VMSYTHLMNGLTGNLDFIFMLSHYDLSILLRKNHC